MRADKGEMPHAHMAAAMLVDQRESRRCPSSLPFSLARRVEMPRVDAVDDLHMARQHALEQLAPARLPALQASSVWLV